MTLEEQNKLIESNIPLVHYCIKKYFNKYMFNDDVISSGYLGLVKAARTFDESKEIKFSTYTCRCIINEIKMYFRRESRHTDELSLDEEIDTDNDGTTTLIEIISIEDKEFSRIEDTSLILSFRKILTEKEFTYLILYYIYGLNQTEIANTFGISKSRVCQLLFNARKKIKLFRK